MQLNQKGCGQIRDLCLNWFFCGTSWEFICHNKLHARTIENVQTVGNSCRNSLFIQHASKTTLVFLPGEGKVSWPLLPDSVSCAIRWHRRGNFLQFCVNDLQLDRIGFLNFFPILIELLQQFEKLKYSAKSTTWSEVNF